MYVCLSAQEFHMFDYEALFQSTAIYNIPNLIGKIASQFSHIEGLVVFDCTHKNLRKQKLGHSEKKNLNTRIEMVV